MPRDERPGWLVNLTNDGWFGISTGPYQHLQQARVRAIEEGLPLVRAANTGISAVIDPVGRTIASLPLGTEGVLDAPLPQPVAPTLYTRIGDFGCRLAGGDSHSSLVGGAGCGIARPLAPNLNVSDLRRSSRRLTLLAFLATLSRMIARRHVYHLAGYDPIDAEAQHRRFTRQLDIFRRTWNVNASLSALERPQDEPSGPLDGERAEGPAGSVEAVHEIWLWDDIVRGDFTQPLPVRLYKAVVAYFDFIATGTMFRYVKANQRYAIFFLFPLLALVLFAAAGWLAARAADRLARTDRAHCRAGRRRVRARGLFRPAALAGPALARAATARRLDIRPRLSLRPPSRRRGAARSICARRWWRAFVPVRWMRS